MKKLTALFLLLIFMLVLVGCKQTNSGTNESSDSISLYQNFLRDLKSNNSDIYYFIKDIDGDNTDDLIIHENTKLSVYTYEKSVKLIGEHDFITGTCRFFSSDNADYPGVFYFTVGGGVDHYGYMTIKDKKLSFEDLWEEHYATQPEGSKERIKELSSNKGLISESKELYKNNCDIKFIPYDSYASDNSKTEYIEPSQLSFSSGNGEIKNSVSRSTFTKPIECMYNGKKITIDTPKFTGIPVESTYSYKKNFDFIDGYVIFDVATSGTIHLKVDKNGKIVAKDNDYQKITAGRDSNKYMEEILNAQKSQEGKIDGRIVGNNVMIKQSGEEGNYVQYLYSVDGKRLSDGYDSIGYFFNGLALAIKDNKVGLIDEKGNAVLSPCIKFDTVVYPPNEKGFYLDFMFEDAFVLPIDGEFAIININR